MTDCPHNDHTHIALWAFVLLLAMHSSCVDCGGHDQRIEERIRTLEGKCK